MEETASQTTEPAEPALPAWLLTDAEPAARPGRHVAEAEEIDYTALPLGKPVRLPRGEIALCPECGRPGLRLVYSARRGRYDIAYWHEALREHPGFAPTLTDGCTVRARRRDELPKAERDRI